MSRVAYLALTLVLCACAAEVTADIGPPPVVVTTGTLTIDWTINGAKDPNLCFQSVADIFEVSIDDARGFFVGTFRQQCQAFATTITLAPGTYTADAALVNGPSGQPRTTTVAIAPFTIRGNDVLSIPIDFPASSFF